MKIALISCVSQKATDNPDVLLPARELYTSPLFKKALKFAEAQNPDRIYILSAKHHLLRQDALVGYYNVTLNKMTASERREWAQEVLLMLEAENVDFENDEFIFFAGRNYLQYILSSGKIKHYKNVYGNFRGIGYLLHYLSNPIKL